MMQPLQTPLAVIFYRSISDCKGGFARFILLLSPRISAGLVHQDPTTNHVQLAEIIKVQHGWM